MLDEHLACPRCGYDLHGIPEIRCPECGFRYDAAAIRSMTASSDWARLAVARVVIVRSAIAAGLMLPAVCGRLGITGWTQFSVVSVGYVVTFSTWLVLTESYRGLISVPSLMTLFVALAVGFGIVLGSFPFLALVIGVAVLAIAWVDRLRSWPVLPLRVDGEADDLQRSVVRHSMVATLMLVVASASLVLVAVG